jgi:protein-L-isoaspartate(D-aspartate) O-methyltransferase
VAGASLGEELRRRLVAELESLGAVRSDRVRGAFLCVPRELFVREYAQREGLEAVYDNELIVTKTDANGFPSSSSSEPQVMAAMLERLELREGMRVLEIGAGTGYNAALLKTIVGPRGRVVSVDLDREVAQKARRALRLGGYSLRVICSDGHLGYAAAAPYDRIVLTAGSATIAPAWIEQLREGGLLELPLRMAAVGPQAIATFRRTGRRLHTVAAVPGQFMQLRSPEGAPPTLAPTLPVLLAPRKGKKPAVVHLSGTSLERLSSAGWQRLMSLGDPRERLLGMRSPAWGLALYLALEIPERELVGRWEDFSMGILGPGGGSIAFVVGSWTGGNRPTPIRIVAYGDAEAEARLDAVLMRWSQLGRPGADQLQIDGTLANGRVKLSQRWTPNS